MGILRRSAWGALLSLAFIATGCVQKEFQDVKAQNIIAAAPVHLDAEQVSLTGGQVECGVQYDLWDPPPGIVRPGELAFARLEQAGRDLHFSDDVVVADPAPGMHSPYVQVRGDFMMQLADGPTVRDDGPDGRRVEGKLMVIIPHTCFMDPLPVLGVRKGHFSEDVQPVLQFHLDPDGWHFVKLVH